MARFFCIVFLLALVVLPGCGGCRSQPEKTQEEIDKELELQKKKEAERLKPDFETGRLVSRPAVSRPIASCSVKPGHWTCVALDDAKTNHFDFAGEFELNATDGDGTPLPIEATLFEISVCRDIALPKGQAKSLESLLFVPPGRKNASAAYQFNAGQGGRSVVELRDPLGGAMPSWQYHFVVLARKPDAYGYLQWLPTVSPPSSIDRSNPAAAYYRVELLPTDRRTSLPSHANQWTSIACVLWDDALPDALDAAQQQAMLDWLHWGGQLIVSGPGTLDSLRNGFLAPYLPAVADGAATLGKNELAAINAFSGKAIRPLTPIRPWSGVRFKLNPKAEFVPGSGDLFVERRVGRGRIVVSAFQLSNRDFVDWRGCDEVYNAMLLRRPSRKHVEDRDGVSQLTWADGSPLFDARRVSPLRYFVRDTGLSFSEYAADAMPDDVESRNPQYIEPIRAPGVAAWSDFNSAARASRETLQNAAKIEIPRREFVAWVVGVYLIVLVPANWIVFRVIRRIEWAWIAAPVIAIVCTVVVIRLAQLDIGFASSQTEVAVVELQAGHPRAHVARYNALYTSLATSYELTGDDAGAAMLPFPTVANPSQFRTSLGQQVRKLTCRRDDRVSLSGFYVGSNSTGLMHSEEMADLGGGLSLTENSDATAALSNRSALNLHGVGLLRKTRSGDLQQAWIGEAPSQKSDRGQGASSPGGLQIRWQDVPSANLLWQRQRDESPVTTSNPPPGTLNLRKLLDLAQDAQSLEPGEVRLIGWSDDDLPGLSIKPAAPQVKRAILVIAHLDYGLGNSPRPDKNLRSANAP